MFSYNQSLSTRSYIAGPFEISDRMVRRMLIGLLISIVIGFTTGGGTIVIGS
jgi:hypothetical protein